MAGEITVTVEDDGLNDNVIQEATSELAAATDVLQTTNETVIETVTETDNKMDDVSDRLTTITERLDSIEGRLTPPDPPVIPEPVPEPDPPLTPNSPEDQVPGIDKLPEVPPDDTVSPGKDDKDIAPKSSGSEGEDKSERKKDKKPRQKLGWKRYVLGGSGGRI